MAHLSFFIGKGGVGKTTLAAAYAVRAASLHPKKPVLLLSTDPAHSLGDAFGLSDSSQQRLFTPRRLPSAKGKLFLWHIDAQLEFDKFFRDHREAMLQLVEGGTMFSRAEVEPLLSTSLPGMAEMGALLSIFRALNSNYDSIVVDSAPIGHTLRLFEMPQHFLRLLDFLDLAAGRDQVLAATFGGKSDVSNHFLAEWRTLANAVASAMTTADSGNQVFLVTTPETFSLNESARAAEALSTGPAAIGITGIILNRATPPSPSSSQRTKDKCAFCLTKARETVAAHKFLGRNFPRVPVLVGQDSGAPVMTAAGLAKFGAHVFDGKRLLPASPPPSSAGLPRLVRARWPTSEGRLVFTLGKGGVGKTTISAGLAVNERRVHKPIPVTICSTDPAPSLDDIFQQPIGDTPVSVLGDSRLRAMEVDSVAHFHRWTAEMKQRVDRALTPQTRGVHVDLSLDRRIFSTLLEIVPPGVDEVLAILRILDLLDSGSSRGKSSQTRLIIDMAPTGHALELLRMPERMLTWTRLLLKILAAHRTMSLAQDLAVEVATLGQRVRQLSAMLKNPRRARVVTVMLAEPLPDRETVRLLAGLKAMQLETPAIFVNRVLFPEDVAGCARCLTASRWQAATLAGFQEHVGRRRDLYVVRNFASQIAGRRGLQSLVRELWRIEPVKSPRARPRRRK